MDFKIEYILFICILVCISVMAVYRKVQHPHILTVLGTVIYDTSIIVLSNFVRGPDLQSLLFGEKQCKVRLIERS